MIEFHTSFVITLLKWELFCSNRDIQQTYTGTVCVLPIPCNSPVNEQNKEWDGELNDLTIKIHVK